jgi:hypothetical protein
MTYVHLTAFIDSLDLRLLFGDAVLLYLSLFDSAQLQRQSLKLIAETKPHFDTKKDANCASCSWFRNIRPAGKIARAALASCSLSTFHSSSRDAIAGARSLYFIAHVFRKPIQFAKVLACSIPINII